MIDEMGRARFPCQAKSGRTFRALGACVGLGLIVMLLLAGCGSAMSAGGANGPARSAASNGGSSSNASAGGTTTNTTAATPGPQNGGGPPFLVKSLQVTIEVTDTRATAGTILAWIGATDPKSTTMGQQYTNEGNGVYNVTLQVSVQATLYPQIEQYLLNYPAKNGGTLLNLQESVTDVTNDYISTQAQIATLQTEHKRLLDLLSQASSLSDILSLDQQLTTVEGQLQQIEAHQQALVGEVTFYNVTVNLQSTGLAAPVTQSGFDFGRTLHDAWNAALVFAGWLAVLAIWLVAFSIFLAPLLAVFLVIRGLRRRRIGRSPPVSQAPAST
jgi:TolA-binding protein